MAQAYGNKFARIYNILWTNFAQSVAPILLQFYKTQGPQNSHILDLCCGTGQLAKYFLTQGYHVIGIDLSEAMLDYARENCREFIELGKARFIKADAKEFTIEEKVGLVVSTYDAMNHLENIEALRSCFHSVYKTLVDSGYFIFDLNTILGLRTGWNSLTFMDKGNIVILNRAIYDEEKKLAVTKITGFLQEEHGFFDRFDEVVYNKGYELDEIKQRLLQEGFQKVYFATLKDLSEPVQQPEKENRIFVVAQK
ncbi:class I SAM-dependent DNA methyltransferase [Pseudothermotoga sp. U03pept]|uniref:class I SAM-dependent DNA methyltransferase n=1 Tax=Pseudothermotoga sp. U03pept TaxID=3447012 RepID=UPI0030A82669